MRCSRTHRLKAMASSANLRVGRLMRGRLKLRNGLVGGCGFALRAASLSSTLSKPLRTQTSCIVNVQIRTESSTLSLNAFDVRLWPPSLPRVKCVAKRNTLTNGCQEVGRDVVQIRPKNETPSDSSC